jgi:hypothetical protein
MELLKPYKINDDRDDKCYQKSFNPPLVLIDADDLVVKQKIINVLNRCKYIVDEVVGRDPIVSL